LTSLLGGNFTKTIHHDTYAAIDPIKANLSGKAVFITGSSKGVGKATAITYAKAGVSKIAIAARSSLSSVKQEVLSAAKDAGREEPAVLSLQLDVSDAKSVEEAANTVQEQWGSLDILINNAGYLETWKSIAETDPEEWWKSWDVNVKGTYLVTRAFIPLLLKGELKTIVNLSSIGGHRARPGASAYQTAKFAIMRFTEFIDSEYGEQGLIAFSSHPGGIPTELALNMPENMHANLNNTPELAGDTLGWLTKERREWLAGRYVSCNWDVEELESKKDTILKGELLKVRMAVGT
jgi:NAD(P)-dependent dehydrogenase (short-subunit alcohol dehydrogenase family)